MGHEVALHRWIQKKTRNPAAGLATASIHTLRWRHMVHLLVQRLVNDSAVPQLDLGIFHVGLVQEGQGVLHPIYVVALGEGLVRMRAARLLARLRGVHLLSGLVDPM